MSLDQAECTTTWNHFKIAHGPYVAPFTHMKNLKLLAIITFLGSTSFALPFQISIKKVSSMYVSKTSSGTAHLQIAADVTHINNKPVSRVITMDIPLNSKQIDMCKQSIENAFQISKIAPNSFLQLSLNVNADEVVSGNNLSYQKVVLLGCFIQ